MNKLRIFQNKLTKQQRKEKKNIIDDNYSQQAIHLFFSNQTLEYSILQVFTRGIIDFTAFHKNIVLTFVFAKMACPLTNKSMSECRIPDRLHGTHNNVHKIVSRHWFLSLPLHMEQQAKKGGYN